VDIDNLTVKMNDEYDVVFESWKEVGHFLHAEESIWNWLQSDGPDLAEIENASSTYRSARHQLRVSFEQSQQNDTPLSAFGNIRQAYGRRGPLFSSTSTVGSAILRAREIDSDRAGAFAYGIATGALNFRNGNSRADAVGLFLVAFPEWGDPEEIATRMSAERANYRSALNRHMSSFEEIRAAQENQWREMIGRAMRASRGHFRRRMRLWDSQQKQRDAAAAKAVASIQNTEKTYTEAMRFKAPVDYWKKEAERHRRAKRWAVARLCAFFPIAAIALGLAFWFSARLLLSYSEEAGAAVHFIIAAGLVALSTITFWIGRLFTKLYLSEHHLEQDAEQRAVMTTTYLALINEGGAAAENDRSAILAQLFRATPDGIVKDDGPADAVSLATLLARLGVR